MQRGFLVLVVVLLAAAGLQAQTRKISHRSHAGSPETFAALLGEDHLGAYNPIPLEVYDVEPFVERLRKHYAKMAKESQPDRNDPTDEQGTLRADTTASPQVDPVPKTKIRKPKEGGSTAAIASPANNQLPPPDFLVKTRPQTDAQGMLSQGSSLWTLLGILGLVAAPVVVILSYLGARQSKD